MKYCNSNTHFGAPWGLSALTCVMGPIRRPEPIHSWIDQGDIQGPPTHLKGTPIVVLVGVLVVLVYHLGQSKNGFAQDAGFIP